MSVGKDVKNQRLAQPVVKNGCVKPLSKVTGLFGKESHEITELNPRLLKEEKQKYIRRKEHVVIDLRIFIYTIENINTLRQEMVCEFLLSANWLEHLKNVKKGTDGEVQWDQIWDPRLYFPNAVEMKSSLNKRAIFTDTVKEKVMIQWSYRVKGRFKCPFDISSFPFDDQVLSIHVSSYWSDTIVKLRQEISIGNSILCALANFADSGQWELQKYVLSDTDGSKEVPLSNVIREPLIQFHVHARRKYIYYLWNIAAMVNMISILAFTSFSIERDDIGKRLSVSLTLLLTVVAFKNFVSSILPKVSYLTLLDKYVLFNVAFIFFVAVENAVVGKVKSNKDKEKYDLAFQHASIILYILYQTVFVILSVRAVKRSRSKFCEKYIGEFSIVHSLRRASEILKIPVTNGMEINSDDTEIHLEVLKSLSQSDELPRKEYFVKSGSVKRYSILENRESSQIIDPYEVTPRLSFRRKANPIDDSSDSSCEDEHLAIKTASSVS